MIWVRHKCKGCGVIRYANILAGLDSRFTCHKKGCGVRYKVSRSDHIPNTKGEEHETERM